MKRIHGYAIIALTALVLDQFLKYLVINHPRLTAGIFNYFHNDQFAWSLGLSNTVSLLLAALFFVGLIFIYWRLRWDAFQRLALLLIMTGALSNIIDRSLRGGVVDYIQLPGGGIINGADIFIFIGVVLLLIRHQNFYAR